MRTEFEEKLQAYDRAHGSFKYVLDALVDGKIDEIEQLVIKAEKSANPETIQQIWSDIGRKVYEDCICFEDAATLEKRSGVSIDEDNFNLDARDRVRDLRIASGK